MERVIKLFQPTVVDMQRFVQNLLAVVAKVCSFRETYIELCVSGDFAASSREGDAHRGDGNYSGWFRGIPKCPKAHKL